MFGDGIMVEFEWNYFFPYRLQSRDEIQISAHVRDRNKNIKLQSFCVC